MTDRGADRSLSRKEPSYGCIVCVCSSVCGREDYGIFDVNNMKCLPALLLAEPDFYVIRNYSVMFMYEKMDSFFGNS